MIYLASNFDARARLTIEELLALAPDYQPDLEVSSPVFASLVGEVKRARRQRLARSRQQQSEGDGPAWKRWLLIGGSAVVAGTAALLLSSGGGGSGGGGGASEPPPLPN